MSEKSEKHNKRDREAKVVRARSMGVLMCVAVRVRRENQLIRIPWETAVRTAARKTVNAIDMMTTTAFRLNGAFVLLRAHIHYHSLLFVSWLP